MWLKNIPVLDICSTQRAEIRGPSHNNTLENTGSLCIDGVYQICGQSSDPNHNTVAVIYQYPSPDSWCIKKEFLNFAHWTQHPVLCICKVGTCVALRREAMMCCHTEREREKAQFGCTEVGITNPLGLVQWNICHGWWPFWPTHYHHYHHRRPAPPLPPSIAAFKSHYKRGSRDTGIKKKKAVAYWTTLQGDTHSLTHTPPLTSA